MPTECRPTDSWIDSNCETTQHIAWGLLVGIASLVYLTLLLALGRAVWFLVQNRGYRGFTDAQFYSFRRLLLLSAMTLSGLVTVVVLSFEFHW